MRGCMSVRRPLCARPPFARSQTAISNVCSLHRRPSWPDRDVLVPPPKRHRTGDRRNKNRAERHGISNNFNYISIGNGNWRRDAGLFGCAETEIGMRCSHVDL